MRIGDLRPADIANQVRDGQFAFSIGSFNIQLKSSLEVVFKGLSALYRDYPLCDSDAIIDFQIALESPNLLRRWFRPQVQFFFDGQAPFKPLPQVQAFAMFEWGLNWCIANQAHEFLVVHAAVIEREGRAFIFPGLPGSGKSTLCAALVNHGWRLLSDEMALISLRDGLLTPVPRPISLKNASIDIIRKLAPEATMGHSVADTAKGTIAHMAAPRSSVYAGTATAKPFRVVFPTYKADANHELVALSRGTALMKMADNSFNYHVLGEIGFDALADTLEQCDSYQLTYHRIDDAILMMEEMNRDG